MLISKSKVIGNDKARTMGQPKAVIEPEFLACRSSMLAITLPRPSVIYPMVSYFYKKKHETMTEKVSIIDICSCGLSQTTISHLILEK